MTSAVSRIELDREQAAILEHKGRGLGLLGEFKGVQDWYGGNVQQIARLDRKEGSEEYQLRLQPLEMRRSNRLLRFMGSRRVLQVRIPDDILKKEREKVLRFLQHKFILGGRVLLPTPPKDDTIYLIEIDENFERNTASWCGDQHRMSYSAFIDWHNPIGLNADQVRMLLRHP